MLPPLLPKMPIGLRAFNWKWEKWKQNDQKAKNRNKTPKQTKHLVSSWLSCLSIPSTKFSLICLAGENSRMAEGRNPLSVIPEKGSVFVPDRTDRFPPGACVPDSASLQCLAGQVFQPWPAAWADAGSAALFGFHRKVRPWGLCGKGCCGWKLSVLTFLDSIVFFLLSVISLNELLQVWFPESS